MQSSSFQGTVPLICPIWPGHLYVVSFHPRWGVARHRGVARIAAICCATVHLSLWIPVTVVNSKPTSSAVSCVFPSNPSSCHIRACLTRARIVRALALHVSVQSTKSACACLFAGQISPWRARLFTSVCGWVCQL